MSFSFAPPNTGVATLKPSAFAARQMCIRDRDYGIGLDPDQIPFIFDGQYSSDTADGHKGIGIGLSICRTIIHAHDGVIHAANLDKGAEFSFTLPKEKENANYA